MYRVAHLYKQVLDEDATALHQLSTALLSCVSCTQLPSLSLFNSQTIASDLGLIVGFLLVPRLSTPPSACYI